jgi:adenine-specific DNA-methyltransferase
MAETVKKHGRVYTPDYIVNLIIDYGKYSSINILSKHVIDNSCGDGSFLKEIVSRYCSEFLSQSNDISSLKSHLETYIHGIELDANECETCIYNLNEIVKQYGISGVAWDIINANTLSISLYNGKMDYVFGNPPYVRVHNLDDSYDEVKHFRFAQKGMTDLYIVFFEIGFKMLSKSGTMSLITPNSWLTSKAGAGLRKYILAHKNLSGLIDLEHFQPFQSTTYTLISRFKKSQRFEKLEYCTFDNHNFRSVFQALIPFGKMCINNSFYLSSLDNLQKLQSIFSAHKYRYVEVKNGFATLADKVFINNFNFKDGTIDILKASTGKWSKCIFPYDQKGKPLSLQSIQKNQDAYAHLLSFQRKLSKERDIENDAFWYLFGRTQAIKDVFRDKIAINTIIKDSKSIRLEKVPSGKGLYSGLYILSEIDYDTIKQILVSEEFVNYVKLLKNYKSGGYYAFSSKELEQYLNYKLSELYGQYRISRSDIELF